MQVSFSYVGSSTYYQIFADAASLTHVDTHLNGCTLSDETLSGEIFVAKQKIRHFRTISHNKSKNAIELK